MSLAKEALVFNGANALEFHDIRSNVIRIPEVIECLREAQAIWDKQTPKAIDLNNFIGSDDAGFTVQAKLKKFVAAVVQVGLYRRYLKQAAAPTFFVGTLQGDSPLRVAVGEMTFEEMVLNSEALTPERLSIVPRDRTALAEEVTYAVFQKCKEGYSRLQVEWCGGRETLEGVVAQFGITKTVVVGPGRFPARIPMIESIAIDPNLKWFWAHAKASRFAVAN